MMGGASSRRGLWLDPRTKILLLLFCILSAMMAPSLFYELGLVVLIGLLGVCFGKWKYAWKGVLFYALIVLLTLWIMDTMTGTWRTMFIAFLGLFHKVYPCGMLSGIVLSTTKVSEFLAAMSRTEKAGDPAGRHAPLCSHHPEGLAVYQGRHADAGCVAVSQGTADAPGHDGGVHLCPADDGGIQGGG